MAATVKASVKWGREKFEVEVDPSEPPEVLRAILYGLTEVPVERQKLMLKGKAIKDDWGATKFKDRMTFLLMGTAEAIVGKGEKVVFVEDLEGSQQLAASNLPVGLKNYGNTCYFNATVQCLRKVPELVEAIENTAAGSRDDGNPHTALVSALSNTFGEMKRQNDLPKLEAATMNLVMRLRATNPQFAEMGEHGYKQQDADEALGSLLSSFRQTVPAPGGGSPPAPGNSIVDQLFGLRYKVTLACKENPDEVPTTRTESEVQLQCPITKDVGYVMAGLKKEFNGELTKGSESLGREAVYTKTTMIDRLPGYVIVKFKRFYFKEKDAVQCKIGKDVKFSFNLDLIELCTPELQKKLVPMRDAMEAHRNAVIEAEVTSKEAAGPAADKAEGSEPEYESFSFPDDPGSNNSGYYELAAVLTHKGRSADSGHYVGWGRLKDDKWALFDDDNVTAAEEQDILKLSGESGVDWHNAYILVYSSKRLPKTPKSADSMDTSGDGDAGEAAADKMDTAEE